MDFYSKLIAIFASLITLPISIFQIIEMYKKYTSYENQRIKKLQTLLNYSKDDRVIRLIESEIQVLVEGELIGDTALSDSERAEYLWLKEQYPSADDMVLKSIYRASLPLEGNKRLIVPDVLKNHVSHKKFLAVLMIPVTVIALFSFTSAAYDGGSLYLKVFSSVLSLFGGINVILFISLCSDYNTAYKLVVGKKNQKKA